MRDNAETTCGPRRKAGGKCPYCGTQRTTPPRDAMPAEPRGRRRGARRRPPRAGRPAAPRRSPAGSPRRPHAAPPPAPRRCRCHEQVPREPHEAEPERQRLAELVVEPLGRVRSVDRRAETMRVVELPPVVVEERRPARARQPVGVRIHRLEVRQRLPVRARPRRLARRRRPLGQQRVDVARLAPRGAAAARDRAARAPAAPPPTSALSSRRRITGRRCSIARRACSCRKPEPAVRRAARSAPRSRPRPARRGRAEQRVGQLRSADPRRYDREPLDGLTALRAEQADAGQHRVLDVRRHLVGRSRERLGDEERVPRVSACTASRRGRCRSPGDDRLARGRAPAGARAAQHPSRCSGCRVDASSRRSAPAAGAHPPPA